MIKSYLSERKQYVKYNGEVSPAIVNNRDVPQGSVLGPILFSIFINDIVSAIGNCNHHLYADDLQIYLNGSPELINLLAAQINDDLSSISKWSKANDMHLNPNKTKVLRIYRGKLDITFPAIMIENNIISYARSLRNLGYIMNSDFTYLLKHILWFETIIKVQAFDSHQD